MRTTPRIDRIELLDLRDRIGSSNNGLFVAAHAGGRSGWYGPISDSVARYIASHLLEAPIGEFAFDHVSISQAQQRKSAGVGGTKVRSWAIGAIDCAAWDLHGQLVGMPVADLIVGRPAPAVRTYASWLRFDITSPEASDTIAEVASHGWALTKWGLRRSVASNASQLARAAALAARAAGGKAAFDALRTWSVRLTRAFGEQVDEKTVHWLEDPLPDGSLSSYRRIASCGLPLAIGEHLLVDDDPTALLKLLRPFAFTIDIVGCGGLTRATSLIGLARQAGIKVFPHGRSLVPSIHLAAAYPDIIPAVEYQLQWEPSRQMLYTNPWLPVRGLMPVKSDPGIGARPRR